MHASTDLMFTVVVLALWLNMIYFCYGLRFLAKLGSNENEKSESSILFYPVSPFGSLAIWAIQDREHSSSSLFLWSSFPFGPFCFEWLEEKGRKGDRMEVKELREYE